MKMKDYLSAVPSQNVIAERYDDSSMFCNDVEYQAIGTGLDIWKLPNLLIIGMDNLERTVAMGIDG